MTQKNKNSTKEVVSKKYNCLIIIPIIISILSFGYGIFNNIANKRLELKVNALSYKPQITVSKCQLTDLEIKSSPFQINQDELINDTIEKKTTAQYTVNFKITLKNVGNNNAHLMLISYTDTTTGDDFFRQFKNDKKFQIFLRDTKADNSYYSDYQINPGTDFSTSIRTSINFLKDNIFTFHLWIVYKNDMGMIYDTYYWYRGKLGDFSLGSYYNIITGQMVNPKIENFENIISFVDDNNSFHIYSKKENRKMIRYFSQLDK